MADAAGLDFVSIVWEPFDLVMRQRDYFHPPLQALVTFLRSGDFAARAQELGGYDLAGSGSVRFRELSKRELMSVMSEQAAWPTELRLAKDRKTLSVSFDSGERVELAAEYLRVKSPSAEVQGHSPDERKTVPGKRNVEIIDVLPIGNYAVRLVFDDMHDTGIYGWDYLRDLGRNHARYWQEYLDELAAKNMTRDPPRAALSLSRRRAIIGGPATLPCPRPGGIAVTVPELEVCNQKCRGNSCGTIGKFSVHSLLTGFARWRRRLAPMPHARRRLRAPGISSICRAQSPNIQTKFTSVVVGPQLSNKATDRVVQLHQEQTRATTTVRRA